MGWRLEFPGKSDQQRSFLTGFRGECNSSWGLAIDLAFDHGANHTVQRPRRDIVDRSFHAARAGHFDNIFRLIDPPSSGQARAG